MAGLSIIFILDSKKLVKEVVIRRPSKGKNTGSSYSYSIRILLYRKPVSTSIREELVEEIKVGITAATTTKKVKAKYSSIIIDRYYARYSGRLSI